MYGSHSIHPSSTTYLGLGHKGSSPSKETQQPVFKVTSSSSSRGTLSRMPWAYTSGPYPGRTCPNHLSWVLSMWKNRNSILSALQMTEFLTPPWEKAQPPFGENSFLLLVSAISFIWSLSNTPISEGGDIDQPINRQSVNLLLYSTLTREPEILKLIYLVQQLVPEPEWEFHPYPAENHCLNLLWNVWCKVEAPTWWSQQNLIICKNQSCDSAIWLRLEIRGKGQPEQNPTPTEKYELLPVMQIKLSLHSYRDLIAPKYEPDTHYSVRTLYRITWAMRLKSTKHV